MPELPEVQVLKEFLDAHTLHRRIVGVTVSASGMLEGVTPRALVLKLAGRELVSSRRHGKNLFARLSGDGWLRFHFGMTGDLHVFRDGSEAPRYVRLRLDFSDGRRLAYTNARKLGRIGFVEDVDAYIEARRLGPDALDLDLDGFHARLRGRRGPIKSVLMNQNAIAGIGNLYADELLFAAGVDPRARTDRLRAETIRDLHRAMRVVLRKAVEVRADWTRLPARWLLPHREGDGKCPRCGGALRRTVVGGRTTYHCPRDQRRARP